MGEHNHCDQKTETLLTEIGERLTEACIGGTILTRSSGDMSDVDGYGDRV